MGRRIFTPCAAGGNTSHIVPFSLLFKCVSAALPAQKMDLDFCMYSSTLEILNAEFSNVVSMLASAMTPLKQACFGAVELPIVRHWGLLCGRGAYDCRAEVPAIFRFRKHC